MGVEAGCEKLVSGEGRRSGYMVQREGRSPVMLCPGSELCELCLEGFGEIKWNAVRPLKETLDKEWI